MMNTDDGPSYTSWHPGYGRRSTKRRSSAHGTESSSWSSMLLRNGASYVQKRPQCSLTRSTARCTHATDTWPLWKKRKNIRSTGCTFFSSPCNCCVPSREVTRSDMVARYIRTVDRSFAEHDFRGVHVRAEYAETASFFTDTSPTCLFLANAYTIHIARSNDAPTRRSQWLSNGTVPVRRRAPRRCRVDRRSWGNFLSCHRRVSLFQWLNP